MKIDKEQIEKLPEELQKEAIALLSQLEEIRESNPLYFYNHPALSGKPPHKRQLDFHSLMTQIKVFFGGNQSGKTTAGIADDLIQAVDREILPDHLLPYKRWEPPFFCRIMTETLQVLELVLYQKLKELIPKDQLMGDTWDSAYDKQLRILRFKNGSIFQFMTYEQDVGRMGGATLHRVHFDEEPPYAVRRENMIRLVKYGGDELLTQTPLHGLSWAYSQIWEQRKEEIRKNVWQNKALGIGIVLVDMDDNPYLSEENKKQVLRGASREEIQARKEGKFVHFAGKIYEEFDPTEHVIPQFKLPENYNMIVGIDPGIRNRAAVVWCALTSDDTMFVVEELYLEGRTVAEVSELIHRTNAAYNCTPIYYVIDPAARNKSHQTGRSDQMEFADHGVVTIVGQHAVEAGINRVRERLQSKKLFIFDSCKHTVEEFKKYRWRDAPRSGEDGRPQPLKTEDHLMDALRYVVMSRPYLPEEVHEENLTLLEQAVRDDQRAAASPYRKHQFGGGIYK